ncbi:MAG: response regulator [Bacteroidetes bacterium]|nr:response regulator [Bacteroidota bacterium]
MNTNKKLEVLVLEDHYYSNKILSKYVNDLLEKHLPKETGYEVQSFKSGTECILNVSKTLDIAILDYYLTHDDSDASVHLNGHEIMRYILKVSPECKIIMVSALRNPSVVSQIKDDGVFAYIDKHVQTHEEIGKALQEVIESNFTKTN